MRLAVVTDWLRSARRELSDAIIQNPVATVLIIVLGMGAYAFHQESEDMHRLCDLTGDHDIWTVNPRTAREQIDDICIGIEPDDAEEPRGP